MKRFLRNPRHRIEIQRNTPARDTDGSEIESWSAFVGAWASVDPLAGREYEAARAIHAEVSHRIRMRYRPGITAEMRVLFRGRIFDILSVIDIEERHLELVLMCEESV